MWFEWFLMLRAEICLKILHLHRTHYKMVEGEMYESNEQ